MKRAGKWLAALAVMGAALLSGCGAAGETAPSPPAAEEVAALFAGDFAADASVTVGLSDETDDVLSLTARLTRSADSCLVEVTAPEHLEGLTFSSVPGGGLAVRYKGLEIRPDSMPGANLGTVLSEALSTLSDPAALTLTETGSGWCVTGGTDAGAFAMLLDDTTHYPLSLTLPGARVGCTFDSFEAMEVFRPERVDEDIRPELEPSETEPAESSPDGGGAGSAAV